MSDRPHTLGLCLTEDLRAHILSYYWPESYDNEFEIFGWLMGCLFSNAEKRHAKESYPGTRALFVGSEPIKASLQDQVRRYQDF